MVAHCFESAPSELLACVHDRHPIWTRFELPKGAQDKFRVGRHSLRGSSSRCTCSRRFPNPATSGYGVAAKGWYCDLRIAEGVASSGTKPLNRKEVHKESFECGAAANCHERDRSLRAASGSPRPALRYCQVRRLSPPTKSKWESRVMTGIECCRLSAAIHASLAGIGVPAAFSSSRMAA